MKMKRVVAVLGVVVAVVLSSVLAGCSQAEPEATTGAEAGVQVVGQTEAGDATRELDTTSWLMLGTLELEGTGDAVTASQAAELLPLWEAVAGGALQGQAEIDAVLKQIEGKMSAAQLTAIEKMALTNESLQAWMSEQGIKMPVGSAGGTAGAGALQDTTEEERAKMREEFQNMDEDERATRMAERGVEQPEGGTRLRGAEGMGPGGGTRGQSGLLYGPLVELLRERAAT